MNGTDAQATCGKTKKALCCNNLASTKWAKELKDSNLFDLYAGLRDLFDHWSLFIVLISLSPCLIFQLSVSLVFCFFLCIPKNNFVWLTHYTWVCLRCCLFSHWTNLLGMICYFFPDAVSKSMQNCNRPGGTQIQLDLSPWSNVDRGQLLWWAG